MFIEGKYGQFWNLKSLAGYKRTRNGLELYFPYGGALIKVGPEHPQFRQIDQFLTQATLGPDQPA